MRNPIFKPSAERSKGELRSVLGAAIRQIDSADLYLAAVTYMDLEDHSIDRAVSRLRADLDGLRRYLAEQRDGIEA
ncbi:MAG TPA: hypothetical protein VNU19_11320 [Candidatus Acidoferrum sp.]|nr:hypothetical protein [Candidatus Acidoferrum sp.]